MSVHAAWRANSRIFRRVVQPARRCFAVQANLKEEESSQKPDESKSVTQTPEDTAKADGAENSKVSDEQINRAVDKMRQNSPEIAQQVLKAWKEAGVTDAAGLRGVLLKTGLTSVVLVVLQTALDAIAAYCSFATSQVIALQDFPLAGLISFVTAALGFYFMFGVALDLFTIGATITATVMLGTKSEAVLSAVQQVAKENTTGLEIVDKAQQAVNTGKVILALNSIATDLQLQDSGGKASMQTVDRLGAMMTLRDAEEKYDFDPVKLGLSLDEAVGIASRFAAYDANTDGRLEFSEFKKFCDASDFELSDKEIKTALTMLDKRGSGYVEFDEFCQWWTDNKSKIA